MLETEREIEVPRNTAHFNILLGNEAGNIEVQLLLLL